MKSRAFPTLLILAPMRTTTMVVVAARETRRKTTGGDRRGGRVGSVSFNEYFHDKYPDCYNTKGFWITSRRLLEVTSRRDYSSKQQLKKAVVVVIILPREQPLGNGRSRGLIFLRGPLAMV